MAIAKMKLVSVIAPTDMLDDVAAACGESRVFHPEDALTFFSDTAGCVRVSGENPYADPLAHLRAAITRAGGKAPRRGAPADDGIPAEEALAFAEQFTAQVAALAVKQSELTALLESQNRDIELFSHFTGLDVDLQQILQCKTIKVRFGRLPRDSREKIAIYASDPYILFFAGASDAQYDWGVYFAPWDMSETIDRIFASFYFERVRIPDVSGKAETVVELLRAHRDATQHKLDAAARELTDVWASRQAEIERMYARLQRLDYLFQIRRYAVRYKNSGILLTGWVPARQEAAFRKRLDTVSGAEYTVERPEDEKSHTPPVQLRNRRLFQPFEFFVGMYGLPHYREIDPTVFFAVTYTLLFGIMFGDVGQGLALALLGFLTWRLKRWAVGRILVPCGLASAAMGCVFGSVFGFEHALDPLYRRLFGWEEKPVEAMSSAGAVRILLAAVVIGLALIVLAMLLNIFSSLRRRSYEHALFGPNGAAGLIFFGALAAGLGGELAFGAHVLTWWYILAFLALPLVLIFLREPLGKLVAREPGWRPERWGEFCVQNFFELFEMLLTYLSNIMSFLRVGAFVLIHAGMMMAVFALAALFGPVGFAVTVVLGNVLVSGMEALLVAIQVLRLEFYEMFSRYYEGDGHAYAPLTPESVS